VKRSMLVLLAMLLLASGIQAAESTPLGTPLAEPLSTALERMDPDEEVILVLKGQGYIRTTAGKLLASYNKTFDEGVKAGVAESAATIGELKAELGFVNDDLKAAAQGRSDAEDRVERYQTGIVIGVVGGSLVVAAVYVFGVWTGLQLQATVP